MALSLNEIKTRAQQFVLNWKDKAATAREEADAQTFENEFFAIFGVPRNQQPRRERRGIKPSARIKLPCLSTKLNC